jgi:hypothetical protein
MAMLMACPVSSPPGSKTIPTKGFGSGVGTGDLDALSVHRVRLRDQAALAADGGQRARDLGGAGQPGQLRLQRLGQRQRPLPAVDRARLQARLQRELPGHAPALDRQRRDVRVLGVLGRLRVVRGGLRGQPIDGAQHPQRQLGPVVRQEVRSWAGLA